MRGALCLLLLPCWLALPRAMDAEPLRVLSYNVHGLPGWAVRDDPAARIPRIAALLGGFDLVLLQEDFAHHEALRGAAPLPTLLRGNESSRLWCPFCSGAGLTLGASDRVAVEDLVNHAYGACAGWLGGQNDCVARKGFQIARVRTPSGAALHVINTHLDAGRADPDRAARAAQIDEMVATVHEQVGDGALLLAGDLNLRLGDPGDDALRARLVGALGLEDSGARARDGGPWNVIDYVLVRSGPETELRVLEAGEDARFVHGDAPLSDHPALFVVLEVRATRGPVPEGR